MTLWLWRNENAIEYEAVMSTVEYYNGTLVLNPVPPLTLALQGLLLKRYFNERNWTRIQRSGCLFLLPAEESAEFKFQRH